MVGRAELAEAVRYNDAITEERGRGDQFPKMLAELGIDAEGASHVAFQRGLRTLAFVKGGDPETWGAIAAAGGLTEEQGKIIAWAAAMFLDGLAAYARAGQVEGRGDAAAG
jgi:hypothetical protein